jgi:hypothetical protein
VGNFVGFIEGKKVGLTDGADVIDVGNMVGITVGWDGTRDGKTVGSTLGEYEDGVAVGSEVGLLLGRLVGTQEGLVVVVIIDGKWKYKMNTTYNLDILTFINL